MNFAQFRQSVESRGLEARDCDTGHWQIKGGRHHRIVNVWPHSKIGFRYEVQGHKGNRPGNLEDAIRLAGPPELSQDGRGAAQAEPAPFDSPPDSPPRVGLIRLAWRFLCWVGRRIY